MSHILVENSPSHEATVISNLFLDTYMPQANGEFVKVYLYLLRAVQGGQDFGLADIADVFDCTERDITRALRYWEKMKLLKLTYENRKLISLAFRSPGSEKTASTAKATSSDIAQAQSSATISVPVPAQSHEEDSAASVQSSEAAPVAAPEERATTSAAPASSTTAAAKRKNISPSKRKELQEEEDVRQFLYIAEQYLGRTLSKTDVDNLLYFYAELHFSADLIEYLIEYCVSKGSQSTRYIETVALAWAEEGITTVKEAKASTNLFHKNYFTILKAMGIKSRNPIEAEVKFMDAWLKDFTTDVISEACQRTVLQTGQASFQYADSILKDWKKKGVKHLSNIDPLDEAHKAKAPKKGAPKTPSKDGNKFTRYPHRQYDYDKINQSLFDQ